MLGKLLKYDFKTEMKSLIPLYLVLIGITLLIRLMDVLITYIPLLNVFYSMLLSMYVFLLIGSFAWTMVVTIRHFYRNILKDEGYLTNTLPVKRSTIILSKEMISIIALLMTTAVVAFSLFIALYHGGIKDLIVDFEFAVNTALGINIPELIVVMIITLIVTYISQMQIFFLSMLLGHTRNYSKVMYSFVYGILIYIAVQIVSLASLGIDFLIKPDLMESMMNDTSLNATSFDGVLLIFYTSIAVMIISMVVIHVLSVYVANKKLNLE